MKLIPLTRGLFAMVDDADFDALSQHNWHANNGMPAHLEPKWYARRHAPGTRKKIRMQNQIMNTPEGMVVDHIDGNSLNNQQSNLRIGTQPQNMRNRKPKANRTGASAAPYKGVTAYPNCLRWKAKIVVNGECIYLGCFKSPELARDAYDRASLQYHGAFARPNQLGTRLDVTV